MNKDDVNVKMANLYYRRGYIDGLQIAKTTMKALLQSIENQLKKEENETSL